MLQCSPAPLIWFDLRGVLFNVSFVCVSSSRLTSQGGKSAVAILGLPGHTMVPHNDCGHRGSQLVSSADILGMRPMRIEETSPAASM